MTLYDVSIRWGPAIIFYASLLVIFGIIVAVLAWKGKLPLCQATGLSTRCYFCTSWSTS